MEEFDMSKLKFEPLARRESKTGLDSLIDPSSVPPEISSKKYEQLENVADSLKISRSFGRPIVFGFGAHLIKNGLSKVLISLIEKGYVQHLLCNEAVVVHDWELAFQGRTEEDVRKYIGEGQFGLWEETGKYLNRAIRFGNEKGLGYGEAVGEFISGGILENERVLHPNKSISILGRAYELGIPVSVSASIGAVIHHNHPKCSFEAIGETSGRDYRKFVESISGLDGGVYLSVGSAIMSPMVFEKALSAAKNYALREGKELDSYDIFVNDIQPSPWDWEKGEPQKDNPAYYLRFFKTFSRMGGKAEYVEMDNRDFLHNLHFLLGK